MLGVSQRECCLYFNSVQRPAVKTKLSDVLALCFVIIMVVAVNIGLLIIYVAR